MRRQEHIDYLDGLRGIAIALVLISHAWGFALVNTAHSVGYTTFLDHLFWHGYEGVSLFLVLSGFCLSIGPLRKRREGHPDWFRPSQFFGRRAWRILPPYYVALTLSVLVGVVYAREQWRPLYSMVRYPVWSSILSHVALVHNLTHARGDLNTSFWSLGLEWQWYLAFPVALVVCLARPRVALLLCLASAVVWTVVTHRPQALPDTSSCMLPARLFEFCCGVVAADLVVRGRRVPVWALILALTPPLTLALQLPATGALSALQHIQDIARFRLGLTQPLYGLAFTALVLLGAQTATTRAALSWRPLVWLGTVSYSVYLVHEPLVEAIDTYGLRWISHPALLAVVAGVGGLVAGVAFHHLVERPCLDRRRRARAEPRLARVFAATDTLWDRAHRRLRAMPHRSAADEDAAPKPLIAR